MLTRQDIEKQLAWELDLFVDPSGGGGPLLEVSDLRKFWEALVTEREQRLSLLAKDTSHYNAVLALNGLMDWFDKRSESFQARCAKGLWANAREVLAAAVAQYPPDQFRGDIGRGSAMVVRRREDGSAQVEME
jgi:hypothetical protein